MYTNNIIVDIVIDISNNIIYTVVIIAVTFDDELYDALEKHGLKNLYETFHNRSISAENIWNVTDDNLVEWKIAPIDQLDYKREMKEWKDRQFIGTMKCYAFL